MGKPRLIILVRHAQSEGNKNRDIHQTVPDHRVKLTPEGRCQAEEAGRKLRSLLRPDDTLHFFTSPYRRTRETTEGILNSLTADTPSPSPFPRHTIKVYEEPRLREQDFGNFQPSSAEMSRMWQERADYGHFFYRIPNGESAADAYDRVSGFNESLWRSFGEKDFASVCVLVTHGLMARVFLMKWYHFSVEYFEDLRNVNHCEFVVMRKDPQSEKYILQNQLRTWSELKEKRESLPASPIPVRKTWGGCRGGYENGTANATKRSARRQNTADLFQDDGTANIEQLQMAMKRNSFKRPETFFPQDENSDDPRGRIGPPFFPTDDTPTKSPEDASTANFPPEATTHNKSSIRKSRVISPDRLAILKAGRDGGGSESGAASMAGSEEDEEVEHQDPARIRHPRSMGLALQGAFDGDGGIRSGVRADALGDQSDVDDGDGGDEGEGEEDEGVGREGGGESFGESVR